VSLTPPNKSILSSPSTPLTGVGASVASFDLTSTPDNVVASETKMDDGTFESSLVRQMTEKETESQRLHAILQKGALFESFSESSDHSKFIWAFVTADAAELRWFKAKEKDKKQARARMQQHLGKGTLRDLLGRVTRRMIADVAAMFYGPDFSPKGFQLYRDRGGIPDTAFTICFHTPKERVNLVCENAGLLDDWFLGLQSLAPLNRYYLTRQQLAQMRSLGAFSQPLVRTRKMPIVEDDEPSTAEPTLEPQGEATHVVVPSIIDEIAETIQSDDDDSDLVLLKALPDTGSDGRSAGARGGSNDNARGTRASSGSDDRNANNRHSRGGNDPTRASGSDDLRASIGSGSGNNDSARSANSSNSTGASSGNDNIRSNSNDNVCSGNDNIRSSSSDNVRNDVRSAGSIDSDDSASNELCLLSSNSNDNRSNASPKNATGSGYSPRPPTSPPPTPPPTPPPQLKVLLPVGQQNSQNSPSNFQRAQSPKSGSLKTPRPPQGQKPPLK
jgi:hypothetical protein